MENHNVRIQRRVSLTNLYIIMHLKLYYSVREGRGLHGWHHVNCTILLSDVSIVFSVIYHILNLFHYAYFKDASVKQIISLLWDFTILDVRILKTKSLSLQTNHDIGCIWLIKDLFQLPT
jgi:hypothetical protein